jgi:hypothetical protein
MRFLFPILLAAGLLASGARAALIVNGNFAADNWPANTAVPSQPTTLTSITGWTLLPGATVVGLGPGFAGIPTASVDLTGWSDSVPGSGISQTLGTTAGNNYTVSFTVYDFGAAISRINYTLNNTLVGNSLTGQGSSFTYSYNFNSIGNDAITFAWPGTIPSNVAVMANVQVTSAAPIPEPGTWAAAALLVGGAAFLRWRKRAVQKRSATS